MNVASRSIPVSLQDDSESIANNVMVRSTSHVIMRNVWSRISLQYYDLCGKYVTDIGFLWYKISLLFSVCIWTKALHDQIWFKNMFNSGIFFV